MKKKRHEMAPCPGACGRGCAQVPKTLCGGKDCLSEASSAAVGRVSRRRNPTAQQPLVGLRCANPTYNWIPD